MTVILMCLVKCNLLELLIILGERNVCYTLNRLIQNNKYVIVNIYLNTVSSRYRPSNNDIN